MIDLIIDLIGYSLGGFFVSFIVSRIVKAFINLVIFDKYKAATFTFIISFIIIITASSLMPIGFLNGLIVYIPFLLLLFFYDIYVTNKKTCKQCDYKNSFYSSVCKKCGNELGGIKMQRGDSFLNIVQKVFLLLGSIALILVVIFTPKVYYLEGSKYNIVGNEVNERIAQLDYDTITVYGVTIVLVTISLVLVAHTKKKE